MIHKTLYNIYARIKYRIVVRAMTRTIDCYVSLGWVRFVLGCIRLGNVRLFAIISLKDLHVDRICPARLLDTCLNSRGRSIYPQFSFKKFAPGAPRVGP